MLKHLQKYFKPAVQAAIQEEVEMTEHNEATALATAATIAELTASLEQATSALATREEAFAAMAAQVEQMSAALAASETAQAEFAAQAKAAVTAARKEKLETVLGTLGAAPVLASLEGADDATFATVLSAFSLNREAESKSEMFKEKGVAATVETPVDEADTATRLAAKFAAQYKTEGNK
jgi:uncharacterized protein (DUF3084 family)